MSSSNVVFNENEEHINNKSEQSADLPLTWYISVLIEAKNTIIICGIFLAILSILAFFFLPLKSEASLEVKEVPKIVSIQYDELNRTINEVNEFNKKISSNFSDLSFSIQLKSIEEFPIQPKKVDEDEIEKISFNIGGETLIDSLFEHLLNREPIFQAIHDNNLLKRGTFADDETYENAIIENAYGVKLIPPTQIVDGVPINQRNFRPYWIIEHAARNEKTLRNIIFDALQIATNRVRKDTVVEFHQIIEQENKRRESLIDRIEQMIQLKSAEYDFEMKTYVAELKEQAELARVLEIEKNALEVRSLSANNEILAISENEKKDPKLFYRGYKALDKEIKLIEQRENNLDFIDDIVPLKTLKFKLEQNKTLEQLQTAFNATPLVKGEFRAASYHKYGIKISKSKTRYMAPIMIFMFGMFFIMCVVVIRRLITL